MPAEIDSMMYVGDTPWHQLGVKLDTPPTTKEALVQAGLDWKVIKEPTYYKRAYFEEPTGHYVTVRSDTNEVLGNVSERYEILQNKEAFEPFNVLLDYGFELETAGAIEEGKKIWVLAKSPDKFLVGDDRIQPYAFLYTSHDGSSSNCFRDTAIRIVCKNTLDFALSKDTKVKFNLKHTRNIKENVTNLSERLKESKGNIKNAIDDMNKMAEYKIGPYELDKYLETSIPYLATRHKESIPEMGIFTRNFAKPVYEKMVDNFYFGRGNKGKTLWDAYNAVTEYYTHDKDYKDWVKTTQFGAPYKYKVNALKVANMMVDMSLTGVTFTA
mgnify:FL=1